MATFTESSTLAQIRDAAMTTGRADSSASLSPDTLTSFRNQFQANPSYSLAQNAVTQVTVDDVALNRSVITNTDHTFSHLLDDWAVTHQKKSGRCWMFAGLNLFRVGAMKKMNLKEFEFSQNYTLFWDKLERANFFLEAMIETATRDVDDRTVAFLLDRPLEDGGQWNMFVNLVKKHGLVPKAAMPETQSSSDTHKMNSVLIHKLREGAMRLRDLRSHGASLNETRAAKNEILAVIHRILCIHLGTPPEKFDWQWNDKDKQFHRDGEMTPREFARKYVVRPRSFTTEITENTEKAKIGETQGRASKGSTSNPASVPSVSSVVASDQFESLNLDEYVCLVHDPRESSPFNCTFTVDYLGNVVGGDQVIYLNVEMNVMKDIAMRTLMGGEPVWFGCDVGKMMRRDMGIWDRDLFDLDTLYDTQFNMSKSARLLYHQTLMTHAMLFTGVDVVSGDGASPSPSGGRGRVSAGDSPWRGEGASAGSANGSSEIRPRRWRVENSWGEENTGRKGFFVMNDSWFDEHMFEIAAKKSMLPDHLVQALDLDPIVLPAWDPMGSLAR